MVMLWLYCDESYDSKAKNPKTFVIAGFMAEEAIWNKIEHSFERKNERVGVQRFHASHLNARDYEFKGWTAQRSKRYVKDLLAILARSRKQLIAVAFSLFADEYRRIIPQEGREKFGEPYVVCFKMLVANIAKLMDDRGFPSDYRFSIILDRNKFNSQAVKTFFAMKEHPDNKRRHRFGTCAPGCWEEFTALQPADLIAYETFRLLQNKRQGVERVRKAIEKMVPYNSFSSKFIGAPFFEEIKPILEASKCGPNGFLLL